MFRSMMLRGIFVCAVGLWVTGCEIEGGELPGDVVRRGPDGSPEDGGDPDAEPGVDAGVGRDTPLAPSDAGRVALPDGGSIVVGSCEGTGGNRQECTCEARTETSCFPGNAAQVNIGVCRAGRARCTATTELGRWGACTGAVLPSMEVCDGVDNDCDGVVDNGCNCRPGATRACYTGPAGTMGVGICRGGIQTCVGTATSSNWGLCMDGVLPHAETCNGADDNCNGRIDDGIGCTCTPGMMRTCYSGPMGTAGVGICRAGMQACNSAGTGWSTCSGERLPAAETCNMMDDDCNGRTDEIAACTAPTATCPPPVTGPAGTAVSISASPAAGSSCRWEVVTRPTGAGTEGTFANPNSCATTFSSVIVGTYTVRLTVTDAMGRTATCTTTITLQGRGLRVELQWDTTGDVDLHLLNSTASAWWNNPNDCYFANMRPSWDGGGTQAPNLDVDNVTSFGPENIRIDSPPVGSTYRVGVHAYSRVDGGSNTTVRIYCGVTTTPVRTFNRRIVSNSSSSGSNDFWRVADVRMEATGGCTITPLDTIVTATASRSAR